MDKESVIMNNGIWVYPVLAFFLYYLILLSSLTFNRATLQFGMRLRIKKLMGLTIEGTYDVYPKMLVLIKKDKKFPAFSNNIGSKKIWCDPPSDKELVEYYAQVDKDPSMPEPTPELLAELEF